MGELNITGEKTEQGVILAVMDNGIGMSSEIASSLLQNKPEGHFGVYSVNHRIKLYFGEEYGIDITSQPGEGTRVRIILPAREFMEGENV